MTGTDKISSLITRLSRKRANSSSTQRFDSERLSNPTLEKKGRSSTAPNSMAALKNDLRQRLQTVDLTTPAGKGDGRRIFFAAVVDWEFHEAGLEVHQRSHLLMQLEERISADNQLRRELDGLLLSIGQSAKR